MKFHVVLEVEAPEVNTEEVKPFCAQLLAIARNELCGTRITADGAPLSIRAAAAMCAKHSVRVTPDTLELPR